MVGSQFKRAFNNIFRRMKCTVYVHKNYGTNDQITIPYQSLKNREENNPSKVMFQFPERVDISVGDIIQQKNAYDLWEVYDTEDTIIGDVFIDFRAKVNKVGAPKPHQHGGNVIIQGSNYGAIQSNSPQANQSVSIVNNNNSISAPITELRKLLQNDEIDELDKEECDVALTRIEELSSRTDEPKALEIIQRKLDMVNSVFGAANNLAELAAPYIDAITRAIAVV